MNKYDKILFSELVQEDNIGLVLRGHLHVEHQLIKFISKQLQYPDRVDWGKIDYSGKAELALACGLDVDIRPGLEHLETLRNNFACSFDAQIAPNWVLVAYNGLPRNLKDAIEVAYKTLGKKIATQSKTLGTRDLLILVFICVANAVETAATNMPKKPGRAKKTTRKGK